MRISSKGQVTIPQEIRDRTGLVPGSEVEFVPDGQRVYLRKVSGTGRGHALVERMRGKGDVGMTTDAIMKLTRGNL